MKKIFAIMMILASANSFALFESQGKVASIKASGDKIIFSICHSNGCDAFWLTPDSDYKNIVVSMLLAAKLSDRLVWIGGSDNPDTAWPYSGARAFSAMDFKG